jgi:hypothetical protein
MAILLVLVPALGTAGGGSSRSPSSGAPDQRPDVFLGYTWTKAGEVGLNGWQLAGGYPVGPSLRAIADLAGHYGSFGGADLSQLTLMGGVRWSWARPRIVPFAEALLGGVRTTTSVPLADGSISDSDTDWGTALGGGVDYRLTGRWAARVRFDLLVLRSEGTWGGDPRLSLGIAYHLGQ